MPNDSRIKEIDQKLTRVEVESEQLEQNIKDLAEEMGVNLEATE